MGRRDDEGGRQLPDLGRDGAGAGDPVAGRDQGSGRHRANAELGLLDAAVAERIAAAGD